MIDINGMAHVILTVSQYDKAKAFYLRLMSAMGLETVFDNEGLTFRRCPHRGGHSALQTGIRGRAFRARARQPDCIIFACVRVRAKTSTRLTRCCARWTRISSRPRRRATGRPDTITKTRTASALR